MTEVTDGRNPPVDPGAAMNVRLVIAAAFDEIRHLVARIVCQCKVEVCRRGVGQSMSRIFLSHSSTDNAHAIAMRDWLAQEGWDDVFLDLDADRGIVAGDRWERRLHEAANRCEAVIFLVSSAWLKSEWCLREFHLAEKLNKRIFSVVIGKLKKATCPRT